MTHRLAFLVLLVAAGQGWANDPCDKLEGATTAHAAEAAKPDSDPRALAGQAGEFAARSAECLGQTKQLAAQTDAAIKALKDGASEDDKALKAAKAELKKWEDSAKAHEDKWAKWATKYWDYKKDSLAQRQLDAVGLNELRELICKSDWGDADEKAAVAKMQSVAAELSTRVKDADRDLDGEADELHKESVAIVGSMKALETKINAAMAKHAEFLAKHPNLKAAIEALVAAGKAYRAKEVHPKYRPTASPSAIQQDKQTRENVKKCVLRGRSHPWVEAARTFGEAKHVAMQKACDLAEIEVPGGRVDCIEFGDKTCSVIEIKPSSWDTGDCEGQARGYLGGLNAMLADDGVKSGSSKKGRFVENCRDAEGKPKQLRVACRKYPECQPKPKSAKVCQ